MARVRVAVTVMSMTRPIMGDGSGAVFCAGSVERNVGDLAVATGRTDEAIRRYTTAIEMNTRIGARPFLALSRLDLPGPLAEAGALVARIDAAARAARTAPESGGALV